MSIVKMNVLNVPPAQREMLEKRFAARAGTVKSSDGFEWFKLLRPVEGTDYYLVSTRWRSEKDFPNWISGPRQAAHRDGSSEGGEAAKPAATDPPFGHSKWFGRRHPRAPIERVIQNSVTKIANGPLTCADSGGEMPAEGVLNNPLRLGCRQ